MAVRPRLATSIERQKGLRLKSIFVSNLHFSVTEPSVRALFEPYGRVDRVNLVTGRDTGHSRGFAFVDMPDSAEADRAIAALNGSDLEGRTLKVSEARPKGEGGHGGFSRGPQGGGRQRRQSGR